MERYGVKIDMVGRYSGKMRWEYMVGQYGRKIWWDDNHNSM